MKYLETIKNESIKTKLTSLYKRKFEIMEEARKYINQNMGYITLQGSELEKFQILVNKVITLQAKIDVLKDLDTKL